MEAGLSGQEYYIGDFGDTRLKNVGAKFFRKVIETSNMCLRRLGENRAGEMQFGRWLRNPKVTQEEITREAGKKTGELSSGLHVLGLQDTSEVNLQKHAKRITGGLGTVGNGRDVGLFVHPLLVIDAETRACLGLAHQHIWVRTKAADKNYQRLPIEEKESCKWLQTAEAGKKRLEKAAMITIIADRESDIYEEWDRIPDHKTHLLTRLCRNRKLADGESLYEVLAKRPVEASYSLDIPARAGKRSAHRAQMEVRYGEVEIRRPKNCRATKKSIKLRVIEVRERSESVVGKEEPVHWRLMTTHRIDQVEDALQCVDWYCERWQIEQLFRTIKKQGLDLESSQIEEGASLMKLVSVGTQAAVHTLQLTMARDGRSDRPATDVFDDEDIKVLEQLQPQLEGQTIKQKNSHPPGKLAWAAWLIGRLGGWKGYASEAKPGPITMLRGQQRFAAMTQGWKLAKMCA